MVETAYKQLALSFCINAACTFNNFIVGRNADAITQLRSQLEEGPRDFVYLWGDAGSGVSHLLQAACQLAGERERRVMYLPLEQLIEFDISVLAGIEAIELLVIDHLEAIAGKPDWEESMFHLFNRLQGQGCAMLVGAVAPPGQLKLQLPDLVSRMASCIIYQIHGLRERDKIALLMRRASEQGLELKEDVAQFILNRSGRDVPTLLAALEQLDRHSMSAGRRLTIPFIKEVMKW